MYVSNVSILQGMTHNVCVLPSGQVDLTGRILSSNIALFKSFNACYIDISNGELSV